MMGYANYWNWGEGMVGSHLPLFGLMTGFGFLLIPFLFWSLFWKGWALWKAAKNDSKVWFVVLLLVNTLGILEILYIFVFGEKVKKTKK